jgi:polysaccharide transporter, PST family
MQKNKKIIENIISLFILQGGNYILPLIIFPYLVRVLGVDKYGVMVAAAAFINYFIVFTDYGFNLTATRDIATNRTDNTNTNKIFSSVMYTKFTMLLLSVLILFVFILAVGSIRNEWSIYLATFIMVISSVLFPIWFFQGMEQMKYITIINLTGRLLSLLLIFLFVKTPSDYFWAVLFQSLGTLIPGIFSFWFVFKKFNIRFVKVELSYIINQIKEGFSVFISGVSILSYTSFNTIIIGFLSGPKEAGMFSVAYKIISALISMTQPVLQTFAPHLSIKFKESISNGRKATFKLGKYLVLFNLLVTLGIILFIEPIIKLVFGNVSHEVIVYTKLMSILPLVTIAAFLIINILMLNEGIIKYSMFIYLAAGIVNVILGPLVLKYTNVSGLIIQYVGIELLITVLAFIIYFRRRNKDEIKYYNT